MTTSISVVRDAPQVGRKLRTPRHTFNIQHKPFVIQPFMIAPVLPGETMKSLLVQGLAKTQPLNADNVGWWYEMYFFYVKHRDLADRDLITNMHLIADTDMSSLDAPANLPTYHAGEGMDWVQLCLESVTEEYFRNEGEPWDVAVSADGLPLASINGDTWLDSAKRANDVPAADAEQLPGETWETTFPNGIDIPAGFEDHYAQWQQMRALKLVETTFEDYLKSFGVKPARELKVQEIHKPELIRYIRDWTYPQVKSINGTAAPIAWWNLSERADKDRFFSEPGFIFGVAVARPKIYLGNQKGAAVAMMNDAYSWLPAVLQDDSFTSLKKFDSGAGPIADVDGEYWVDIRDLLMYGDQFVNRTQITNPMNMVPLPKTTLQRRYVDAADLPKFFSDFVTNNYVECDGAVNLNIMSRIRDTSLHGAGGSPATMGGGIG